MANNGFSAPVNYWGTITGLIPKSSNDGYNPSLVTARNAKGDTVAFDRVGGVLAPTVEYAIAAEFENENNVIALGKVVSYVNGSITQKLMMTQVVAVTQAGSPPILRISGVQVENTAETKRTYPVAIHILPRSKAQDVAGAFNVSVPLNSVETTYSVEAAVPTIGGWPAAHDLGNGKIEANATAIRPFTGGTYDKSNDFDLFMLGEASHPDAGYITRPMTAIKYLTGVDA